MNGGQPSNSGSKCMESSMSESGFKAGVKTLLRETLFLPNGVCPVCGKVLFRTESYLCERCAQSLPRVTMPSCKYCGKPLPEKGLDFCGDCGPLKDPVLAGGAVWLHYSGSGQRLVHSLKFGHLPQLGSWIGRQMAEAVREKDWAGKLELVVAVPLHEKRLEERGYNQSSYLAEGLAGALNLPSKRKVLKRLYDTPHQIGLSREERLINLTGAFDVLEKKAVSGKTVLLVDDVNTTGSTLRECAEVLKRAGARAVYAAACAGAQ